MASTKENEMDKRNESKTPAPQQDVIVLGVASVETLGGGAVPGEMIGRQSPAEISEE
ncbi:hypothetical protein [Pseudoxanthomonas composti]|uniref:hypothetical protein n=1 Tax=Pseudoxanthomonas composti TaxID=2137479 RepID=UPI0013E9843E|nr:hypothetical protein [Pseudoxanthomonas composti]